MAKPQKENGFTPIANEILDQIVLYPFNASQLKIIIKIWRMTYGYSRKDHELAVSWLQKATGLSDRTIKKEIASLIKAKVLVVTQNETSTTARKLAFNKDYDSWNFTKSGDSMVQQIDLFSMDGGKDCSPQNDHDRGEGLFTPEGKDRSPQNGLEGGSIVPPNKESISLKKSIKEKESMFEQFYEIYPRRVSRKTAESAWKKLCKEKGFDPDKAIFKTMNFAETCKLLKTETKFIPYPATFLNQKRYEDYEVIDPEGLAAKKQSKVSSNLEFLQQQLRGGGNEQARSYIDSGQGISSLPKPST
ncbi:replication protein [Paenibacillus camelliae]|uniref:replication protein n=1 Tax=Paenibacillus camelliae TaxID=512410 RepID=UPI00203DC751|nr:replication protein [Paenibacillus camelliae]MCM3632894.1 replication protein [Paenibacillus camelliae]